LNTWNYNASICNANLNWKLLKSQKMQTSDTFSYFSLPGTIDLSIDAIQIHLKSEIFEIFFCRKNFFKHYFFNMGHQRPTNGEYITGENKFFGRPWSPGEPSEEMPIKHRENIFMSIKIDRVIRFCSTFFFKVRYWWWPGKNVHFRFQRHLCQLESWTEAGN
jgi:hypothetical protein